MKSQISGECVRETAKGRIAFSGGGFVISTPGYKVVKITIFNANLAAWFNMVLRGYPVGAVFMPSTPYFLSGL